MMNKAVTILTLITNCFIIAGVSRHWNYGNNTKLATPQQEAAQIQKETTDNTSCKKTY